MAYFEERTGQHCSECGRGTEFHINQVKDSSGNLFIDERRGPSCWVAGCVAHEEFKQNEG